MNIRFCFLLVCITFVLSSCLHLSYYADIDENGYAHLELLYDYAAYKDSMLEEYWSIQTDQLPSDVCEDPNTPIWAENVVCNKIDDFTYTLTFGMDYSENWAFKKDWSYYIFNLYKASLDGSEENKLDTQAKIDNELKNLNSFGITGTFRISLPWELVSTQVGKIEWNEVVLDLTESYLLEDTYIVSKVPVLTTAVESDISKENDLWKLIIEKDIDNTLLVQYKKEYIIKRWKLLKIYSKKEVEQFESIIMSLSEEQLEKAKLHLDENVSLDIFVVFMKAFINYEYYRY